MDIKDILKNRREELNITMKELSKKVGVSESTISRWESGDIANMKRDKIVLLADALSISPSVIMGWNDNAQSSPQLRDDELSLLEGYNKLDAIDQAELRGTLRGLLLSEKYQKDGAMEA